MKRIINVLLVAFVLSLVPATYASAQWKMRGDYSEGLAAVRDDNWRCGFIDKTGKLVIPCKWISARSFSEGLAAVTDDNKKCGYISPGRRGNSYCCSGDIRIIRVTSSRAARMLCIQRAVP